MYYCWFQDMHRDDWSRARTVRHNQPIRGQYPGRPIRGCVSHSWIKFWRHEEQGRTKCVEALSLLWPLIGWEWSHDLDWSRGWWLEPSQGRPLSSLLSLLCPVPYRVSSPYEWEIIASARYPRKEWIPIVKVVMYVLFSRVYV